MGSSINLGLVGVPPLFRDVIRVLVEKTPDISLIDEPVLPATALRQVDSLRLDALLVNTAADAARRAAMRVHREYPNLNIVSFATRDRDRLGDRFTRLLDPSPEALLRAIRGRAEPFR